MTALAQPVAKGTIRRWGNSLGLRIPSEVLKLTKLGEGVESGFCTSTPGVRSHDESYEPVGEEII